MLNKNFLRRRRRFTSDAHYLFCNKICLKKKGKVEDDDEEEHKKLDYSRHVVCQVFIVRPVLSEQHSCSLQKCVAQVHIFIHKIHYYSRHF